jgi:hypothetical protein
MHAASYTIKGRLLARSMKIPDRLAAFSERAKIYFDGEAPRRVNSKKDPDLCVRCTSFMQSFLAMLGVPVALAGSSNPQGNGAPEPRSRRSRLSGFLCVLAYTCRSAFSVPSLRKVSTPLGKNFATLAIVVVIFCLAGLEKLPLWPCCRSVNLDRLLLIPRCRRTKSRPGAPSGHNKRSATSYSPPHYAL